MLKVVKIFAILVVCSEFIVPFTCDLGIVNGDPTIIELHPHQVSINRKIYDWFVIPRTINAAGGSILDKRWILAAAHSFRKENGDIDRSEWGWIRTGSTSGTSGGAEYQIKQVHIHPAFNYTFAQNDELFWN